MGNCLLPGLSLVQANPSLSLELWEVMRLLPFKDRFSIYGLWAHNQHGGYSVARASVQREVSDLLKRLTIETIKQSGRSVAKLSHQVPDVIANSLVQAASKWSNFTSPIVDALKYFTPLSLDVLNWSIITFLAEKDPQLESKPWAATVQNVASFVGLLYKKYSAKIEMPPLLEYLFLQLLHTNTRQIPLIIELLERLAEFHVHEDVYDEHVMMLNSGGAKLRDIGQSIIIPESARVQGSGRATDVLSQALVRLSPFS